MAIVATKKISGYQRQCGRQNGGVSRVGIIEAADVENVTVTEGTVTEIKLKTGSSFKDYQSELDQAEFTCNNGETNILVRLNRVGAVASEAVRSLEACAPCGLIALVQLNNGEIALVGYTEEFGSTRPITTVDSEFNSGKALGDANYVDVTFKTSQVDPPLFLAASLKTSVDTLFTAAS